MTLQELELLNLFKSLGTLTQAQALEYHELLNKESINLIQEAITEVRKEKKKKK